MLTLLLLAILPHTIASPVAASAVDQLGGRGPIAKLPGLHVFITEPQPGILREHCDLIDANDFYDEYGRHVFCQLLFFDWHSGDGRYHLRAWRMLKTYPGTKEHEKVTILPQYDHARKLWVLEMFDGDLQRRITAEAYRTSTTQYDPEITEREFRRKEDRRELRAK